MKVHPPLPVVKKPVEDWDPEADFFAPKEAPRTTPTVPSLAVPPQLADSARSTSSAVISPRGVTEVKLSPKSEITPVNSKGAVTPKSRPETPKGAEGTPEPEVPKSPKREPDAVQSYIGLDVKRENPKAGQYLEPKKHATDVKYDAYTLQEFENAIFQALSQLYKTFQASPSYQPRGTRV